MRREITDRRARDLLKIFYKKDSTILSKVKNHRWVMGERQKNFISWVSGVKDFFQYELQDKDEGYVNCFLDYVPEGQYDIPASDNIKCGGYCISVSKLNKAQRKDLEGEFETHRWYLSQKAGYDVGSKAAMMDFMTEDLNEWCKGYRECFEERVCPARNKCDIKLTEKTKERISA
jgi:hypothetical protein